MAEADFPNEGHSHEEHESGHAAGAHHHRGALTPERLCRRSANAFAAARHDGDLAFEPEVHYAAVAAAACIMGGSSF